MVSRAWRCARLYWNPGPPSVPGGDGQLTLLLTFSGGVQANAKRERKKCSRLSAEFTPEPILWERSEQDDDNDAELSG